MFSSRVALSVVLVALAPGCKQKSDRITTLPNSSYRPECVALDATHVYWTASGHVFRAKRTGGGVEDFEATVGRPRSIAVADDASRGSTKRRRPS